MSGIVSHFKMCFPEQWGGKDRKEERRRVWSMGRDV